MSDWGANPLKTDAEQVFAFLIRETALSKDSLRG
jgi:hypothetical protein